MIVIKLTQCLFKLAIKYKGIQIENLQKKTKKPNKNIQLS